MTNTFVLEGETDPDDIIRSVDFGIYAVQLGGGQVDPATGDFGSASPRRILIEKGDDHPNDPRRAADRQRSEVLRGVDAVGNDFETWTGNVRQAGSERMPVSSGQPTVLVREILSGTPA